MKTATQERLANKLAANGERASASGKPCAGCGGKTKAKPCAGCKGCVTPAKALAESGSDKAAHGYGAMYDHLLRDHPATILEIGVLKGDSIRAWRKAFPHAAIVAADCDPDCAAAIADIPDVSFVSLDVSDREALQRFAAEHRDRFALIVDDSSHIPEHQRNIRELLWPALVPGGVMVIEDVDDDLCVQWCVECGGNVWDYRRETKDPCSRAVSWQRPVPIPAAATGRPRVLFASHELSLTGAPQVLANLVPALRGIGAVVYSPHDGPMRRRHEERGVPVTTTLNLDGVAAVVANSLPSAPVIAAARQRGIPAVWLIHESDPTMCGNLDAVIAQLDYCRHIVFPAHSTATAYRAWCADRSVVIHSVIPPVPKGRRELVCRREPFVILSMGTDEPRKGQSDIRAAVAGMEGVEFWSVAGAEMPHDYFAAADLYICSSRLEAFPLAIQEAKAHGLPVITTPVYGCAEQIRDEVDGLHYQPGDVSGLRRQIERIRFDADLRARLSQPLTHLPMWDEAVRQYEQVIHAAAGLPTEQAVTVIYHSAGMAGGWWRGIVSEQFASLARAGLRELLNTHVGDDPQFVLDEASRYGLRLTMCEYHRDVREWETPAMRLMERVARHGDTPILYLHTKAASRHPVNEPVYHDWRRLMQRELVERWRDHLPLLSTHDVIGVNWWDNYPHFSGNFWLARTDWIRRLPPFNSIYRDRYSCERWIGLAPRPRVRSLVCRNKRFWVAGSDQRFLYQVLRPEN